MFFYVVLFFLIVNNASLEGWDFSQGEMKIISSKGSFLSC